MIIDAASIDIQPALLDECQEEKRVLPYVVQISAQGVQVVKIPPEWTWQVEPVKKLLGCLSLQDNWNSYGGRAPSLGTILAAIDFVSMISYDDPPRPRIVPVATGGIQFEWKNGRRELEVEVRPDRSVEYLKVDDANPDGEEGRITSPTPFHVEALLSWLIAG